MMRYGTIQRSQFEPAAAIGILCLKLAFATLQICAFSAAVTGAARAQAPADAGTQSLSNEEREARIEKLRLEIAALKNPPPWYRPILDATPLITVALTLAGLWAGAFKYFEDQRQSREERQQSRADQQSLQIRSNIDQILSFPTDNKITSARVIFLLHDLDTLTVNDVNTRNKITDVLESLIENNLNFDQRRDVNFDIAAMSNWPDYERRLHQRGGSPVLRYNYFQALRHLSEKHQAYFSSIDYDRTEERFVVKSYVEESQFQLFVLLVTGYQLHMGLIRSAAERKEAVEQFARALQNERLAEHLFGADETGTSVVHRR